MPTNEELAEMIQQGQRELMPELWDQLYRFVCYKANRWCAAWKHNRPGLEPDDLIQSAFPALVQAVDSFSPEKGLFVTWFNYHMKTAFAEELGCRSPAQLKRLENNTISLDTELPDGDGATLCDLIEDPSALQAFEDCEDRLYREEIRPVVHAAVDALPDRQRDVVRLRYLEDKTLKETGSQIGVSAENVRQHERKALRTLARDKSMKRLYYGERNLYRRTGLQSWMRTGCSVQELEVMRLCRKRTMKKQ